MRLFYIKAGDDINNLDLFAWAMSAEGAVKHWRNYYETDEGEQPERVWEIPQATHYLRDGPLTWDVDVVPVA